MLLKLINSVKAGFSCDVVNLERAKLSSVVVDLVFTMTLQRAVDEL